MAVIGFWEVALLLGVLMMFFGAKKLPQLAKGLGSGIRNFKGELQAPVEESEDGEEEGTGTSADRCRELRLAFSYYYRS